MPGGTLSIRLPLRQTVRFAEGSDAKVVQLVFPAITAPIFFRYVGVLFFLVFINTKTHGRQTAAVWSMHEDPASLPLSNSSQVDGAHPDTAPSDVPCCYRLHKSVIPVVAEIIRRVAERRVSFRPSLPAWPAPATGSAHVFIRSAKPSSSTYGGLVTIRSYCSFDANRGTGRNGSASRDEDQAGGTQMCSDGRVRGIYRIDFRLRVEAYRRRRWRSRHRCTYHGCAAA